MVSVVYVSGLDLESLFPLTKKEKPVPNITVLGKPVAVWIAQAAMSGGFEDIVVAYPSISQQVRASIGEKALLLDCAGKLAARCASEALREAKDDEVALIVGSHVFPPDFLRSAVDSWKESGGARLAVVVPDQPLQEEKIERIGVEVEFIGKYVRRASIIREEASPYTFAGTIVGEKEDLLSFFEGSERAADAVLRALNSGKPSFYIYSGRYTPLASPWKLLELVKSLLSESEGVFIGQDAKVSPTAILEGPVVVESGATIDHYSVIKGPAYISKGAFIGAHTLLRSGVSVEPYAVIGAGVELKRSYVGSRATIGSNSNVTDSVIGERATLRPMVVTLNYDLQEARAKGEAYRKKGAIVGEGAIINGGKTLKPGSVIEPEQLYL